MNAKGILIRGLLLSTLTLGTAFTSCQRLEPTSVVGGKADASGSAKAKAKPSVKAESITIDLGKPDYSLALSDKERARVVGKVNDREITQAELYDQVGSMMFKLRTDIASKEYRVKTQGLDELIDSILLEEEAKRQGLTVDELVKQEIESKVTPPTEEELQAFFNQNRRRMRPGTTLEDKRDELQEVFMQRKIQAEQATYVKGLRESTKIETMIPYPDLPVAQVDADDDARRGNADAPIQIIEWSDYQCPYCKRNVPILKEVEEKYGDQVSVVFRDFPLPFHSKAQKAAEAAECAGDQEKYWEFHDALFENQSALDVDDLKKLAGTLELDQKAFDECLDSSKHEAEVAKDAADGKVAGVTGTPASFINGKMVNGAQPIENYEAIIESELVRLGLK